ncbi:chromatin modification- protein eaf6, partial [Linderina pennispora]
TESAIYDFETSYFENSGQDGNIVHGFEGYLNTGRHERRQFHFTDADRIFSQSSATFKKAQEARIAAAMQDSDSDSSVASSGVVRGRKHASGGGTIKHNRHGPSNGRGTPGPSGRPTKKIKLSIDGN